MSRHFLAVLGEYRKHSDMERLSPVIPVLVVHISAKTWLSCNERNKELRRWPRQARNTGLVDVKVFILGSCSLVSSLKLHQY